MKILFRGHAFFELQTATGLNIVIDPYTDNGLTKAKPKDLKPDLVLLTHGHGDHVGCALELSAPTVCIYEMSNYLSRKGHRSAIGMNIGGSYRTEGVSVLMTQAFHSSGISPPSGPFDGYGGSPCGFIIDDGTTRFYHMGDTGLFGDLRSVIGEVYKPTVAAVPIGDLYTMGPQHGALAAAWSGVKHAIPIHYDTFPPIKQDPKVFVEALKVTAPKAQAHVLAADDGVDL